MMMRVFLLMAIGCGCIFPANAKSLIAAHTIRSRTLLTADDILVKDITVPGALTDPADVIGKEARVVLYAGRPVRRQDIGPPAIIERNQVITLIYQRGVLRISAEARSLGRAGVGDRVRVMNLASRTTVTGVVNRDGTVIVGN